MPYPDRGEDPTPDSLGCGGLYTVGAFNYVDPKPPSYQPLSRVTTTLVKKDDLAAIALTGSRWVDCSPPFPESLTEHPLTVGAGISSRFDFGDRLASAVSVRFPVIALVPTYTPTATLPPGTFAARRSTFRETGAGCAAGLAMLMMRRPPLPSAT